MSRVGIHSLNFNKEGSKKVLYMPLAKIVYNEKDKKNASVYLDPTMVKKNYFKNWIVGLTFFVGITEDGYEIYNEEGERTGKVSINDVGKAIQVNEDFFICLKGKLASWIGIDGSIIDRRDLTDEEMKYFESDES
jgi:hypothetical protein